MNCPQLLCKMSIADIPPEVWTWYGDQNVIWALRATSRQFGRIADADGQQSGPGPFWYTHVTGRFYMCGNGTISEYGRILLSPLRYTSAFTASLRRGAATMIRTGVMIYLAARGDVEYFARIFKLGACDEYKRVSRGVSCLPERGTLGFSSDALKFGRTFMVPGTEYAHIYRVARSVRDVVTFTIYSSPFPPEAFADCGLSIWMPVASIEK